MENNIKDIILNEMPLGVIVFDEKLKVIYSNNQANNFLKMHNPPLELLELVKKLFNSYRIYGRKELLPAELYLTKRFRKSQNNWTLSFQLHEGPDPVVCVFITGVSVSQKIDIDGISSKFKLTHRETDILRYVLDGLLNHEIAVELRISRQTVKDHVSKIYMKVGAKNRFSLLSLLINLSG